MAREQRKKTRKKCKVCEGTGQVTDPKYDGVIFFVPPLDYMITCPSCNGTGQRNKTKDEIL